ncbi:endonuclease/exonuclease/phosphatase family protein [Streptomyces sp. NPDC052225]|uniref:endonuclease/exonuclease/phosphatase family protein n=1 Tax=Streptomyces sp. NPDC052225 TaxID=3154949 RepID=UPI00342329BD
MAVRRVTPGARRRRALLGLVGCLLAVAACGSPPADPAPRAPRATGTTYRVWQWNVAGNTLHHGSTTDRLPEAAAASITERNIDFAAFNEVCHGQFQRIRQNLIDAGWPEDPDTFDRFEPGLPGGDPEICGGDSYGIALFSKAPLGPADRRTLPDDGTGEPRKLLCAPLAKTPHRRLCTTHIGISQEVADNGKLYSANQLDDVLDTVERYHAAGDTVILAGDFNAQPTYDRLWPYQTRHGGHYRELDDSDKGHCPGYGEWTADDVPGTAPPCGDKAKIDMIFVREDRIAGPYSADALPIPRGCTGTPACSDHRILTGTVVLKD